MPPGSDVGQTKWWGPALYPSTNSRIRILESSVQYDSITSQEQLVDYCAGFGGASVIGFDTEFVSEYTYRSDLCLIQVAVDGKLAIIDSRAVDDLTPFWHALANGSQQTVVHAGREEFHFCRRAIGCRPHGLLDIQIAAGFIGLEYPASYGKLLSKLLGVTLSKGETRTDWRKRPLSKQQLRYALDDVVYLEELHGKLTELLGSLGRLGWFQEEMESWQKQLEDDESKERWRRVSGISGLSSKAKVLVRELWRWRELEAERRNSPPRRVLRDDLIVELARRGVSDHSRIRSLRGMDRRELKEYIPQLADCIRNASKLPQEDSFDFESRKAKQYPNELSQFLTTALGSLCRGKQLAPSLVGTAQGVRDLIAYRLEQDSPGEPPALMRGWRGEVVGQTLDDLLAGRTTIRIANPLADEPLMIEPTK